MWDDDNDEELRRALEESARLYEEVELPRLSQRVLSPVTISDDGLPGPSTSAQTSIPRDVFKKPYPPAKLEVEESELYDGPEAEGFDLNSGKIWVYPKNDKFPVRTYQRSIVETALFHNTLVSLPTGLGKTFIAAVVMYNFYMWYPKGKIIFMAPTKPLVAQQIENCINIMGIPESHTAEMTGALQSKLRAVTWKEKRVFFLTPQVVQNDLSANICPALSVKCVVIDEAHRALGDHAYAQVIRLLNSYNANYRVLALSATPGSDLEAVQKVLSNLMISRIEVRTEDSSDITKYTHERNLELMVVDVGPTINRIRVKFVGIAAGYAQRLQQRKLLFGNISNMPRFTVLKEWENFRREEANSVGREEQNKLNTDFATVHMFVHGLELLSTYGLRLLLNHLKAAMEKKDAVANRLAVDEDVKALINEIDGVLNPVELDEEVNGKINKRRIYGHPKLDRLQEIVVAHFESFQQKGEATRAIVFCEYREGVVEICEMLKNFEPLVKPVAFMGQSVGKSTKGITQKQQLEIMEKFKRGLYNTLVSTSVGEEGLDIGEVDLIICFDAKNSPIRQVQRMGRTGRKRNGRIIMLVTRGKEEQKYNQGLFKKKNVRAVMLNKENLANHLLDESPRMLPPGVQPEYTEREIAGTTNKPKSGQQDLRKMFLKRGSNNSGGSSKPSTSGRATIGKVPYLSEDELEELKSFWKDQSCYDFNKIPDKCELWVKTPDEIGCQELLPSNVDLATYVEYMRFRQRTHIVGNSTDSDMLSDLLMWADERRDSDQRFLCRGFSSQVTSSQLWPSKSKKRGRPASTDTKDSNLPKKRGRPRKDSNLDSPFKAQPKADINIEENEAAQQPLKPKCKPMFIEDDEDDSPVSPEPVTKPHILKTPSPAFLPPQPKSSSDIHLKESPASEYEVICVDSEDDDDLNTSSITGFTQLSSQPGKQELYRQLSKALRDLTMEEEDECNICNDLFLCKSFNKLALESKRRKMDESWKDVSKSLDKVLNFVPRLTKQVFEKQHALDSNSQKIVSLIPNPEIIAEDEMFSGMLCGGVGDLSVSPSKYVSSSQSVSSPRKNYSALKQKFSSPPKAHFSTQHIKAEITEEIECTMTPKKESDVKIEDQFEDMSFDFLGLSKMDDLFGSQEKDLTSKDQTPIIDNCNTTNTSKIKSSSLIPENSSHDIPVRKNTSETVPLNIEEEFPVKSCTPPRKKHVISEQVSPILGSQQAMKPRPPLRLRKISSRSELQSVSEHTRPSDIVKENEEKETVSDKEVSSSSQLSNKKTNLLDINFDLFDDSLFPLSGEDNGNVSGGNANNGKSSNVDDALKEAIRKKALEAKSKQQEKTFSQELRQMCETTLGGITQIMEMYDSKTVSPELRIERADSSSSLGKANQSSSPLNYSDEMNAAKLEDNDELSRSEEDLFADCDDEIFVKADCLLPVTSNNLPESPPKHLDKNDVSSTEHNQQKPIGICEEVYNSTDQDGAEESEVVMVSDRSMSPIFRPSQTVRRPSKLRLKKKSIDGPDPKRDETKPETNKTNRLVSVPKQPDSFSQVDFSMFGDEFNNTWLCSQEENQGTVNTKSIPDLVTIVEPTSNVTVETQAPKNSNNNDAVPKNKWDDNLRTTRERTPENEIAEVHTPVLKKCSLRDNTPENEIEEIQSPELSKRLSRDSTPENELDAAFALFDAARKAKKKSFEGASASTPKVSKGYKFLGKPPSSKTSVNQSFSSKRFPLNNKWQAKSLKTGWISAKPTPRETQDFSEEASVQNSAFNLSDFCDDSILDVLDTIETKTETINSANKGHTVKAQSNQSNFNGQGKKKKLSLATKKSNHLPSTRKLETAPSVSAAKIKETHENSILILSSDDEDIQHTRKGKNCALNVTTSSEENFRSGQTNPTSRPSSHIRKRNRAVLQSSSSSSDTILRKDTKISRTDDFGCTDKNNPLNLSEFCDDSILNEFLDEDENNGLGSISKVDDRDHSTDSDDFVQQNRKRPQKPKKKKKRSKKGNGFIVCEAEESDDGDGGSSDGDSSNMDELDSSFINDSQPEASQAIVDIHDKYLQSIRSPAVGRFKIPRNLPNVCLDIYSQAPDAEELDQTYANDSFCVDDEPTQYEPEMSLLEIAEARLKAERRQKRKLKKAGGSDNQPKKLNNEPESDDSVEELIGKRKRLKRIKIMEETMVEEKQVTAPENSFVVPQDVEKRDFEEYREPVDDLAMLLDDDLDFSAIPDIPEIPKSSNPTYEAGPSGCKNFSKFVKKTSVMSGDGKLKVVQPHTHKASNVMEVPQAMGHLKQATITSSDAASRSTDHAVSAYCKPAPSASAVCGKVNPGASRPSSRILIIASSKQLSSSTDLLRVLRVNYNVDIVPRGGLETDFILSWRFGVSRIFSSDLKDRKKLEELTKKLRGSFIKPYIIIENDRVKSLAMVGFQKKGKNAKTKAPLQADQPASTLSPWNSAASCANATLMRQAGLFLLFSQNYDETAGFLAKLARKETDACQGVPELAVNLSDEVESKLSFFTSLPGINFAFALKLSSRYSTLEEFFERCSSVRDISVTLGVDVNLARKIHNLLCEVHVSP